MRVSVKGNGEPRAIVQTSLPVSLLRRLKLASVTREETMQDIIARAVERELTEQEIVSRNRCSGGDRL